MQYRLSQHEGSDCLYVTLEGDKLLRNVHFSRALCLSKLVPKNSSLFVLSHLFLVYLIGLVKHRPADF